MNRQKIIKAVAQLMCEGKPVARDEKYFVRPYSAITWLCSPNHWGLSILHGNTKCQLVLERSKQLAAVNCKTFDDAIEELTQTKNCFIFCWKNYAISGFYEEVEVITD